METNKLGKPQQRTKPKIVINTVAVTLVLVLLSTVGILLAYHIKNGLDMSKNKLPPSIVADSLPQQLAHPISENHSELLDIYNTQDSNANFSSDYNKDNEKIEVFNSNIINTKSIPQVAQQNNNIKQDTKSTSNVPKTNKYNSQETQDIDIDLLPDTLVFAEVAELTNQDIQETNAKQQNFDKNNARIGGVAYARGTLYFENSQNQILPLKYSKVELFDVDILSYDLLGTTYTDENGNFSFAFVNLDLEDLIPIPSGQDLVIRWYPESYTLKVGPAIGGIIDYVAQSDKQYNDVQDNSTTIFNYYIEYQGLKANEQVANTNQIFTPNRQTKDIIDDLVGKGSANRAFFVAQGMIVGQRFANAMGNMPNGKLRVMYPTPFADMPSFGYGGAVQEMVAFITGVSQLFPLINIALPALLLILDLYSYQGISGIEAKAFENWDTLSHEYGHFVEGRMGNYGISVVEMIANANNFQHYGTWDHFYTTMHKGGSNKNFTMKLAWTEAWASAFSEMAQDYYKNEYIGTYDFANATYYEEYVIEELYTFIKEPDNDGYNGGESQELSISAFLWDLYDNENNYQDRQESNDTMSMSHKTWWDVSTKKGIHTLNDFTNHLYSALPQYRSEIGNILGNAQIAPTSLGIYDPYNVNDQRPLEVIWKVNGSQRHPNSRFKLAFYDANNNLRYTTDYIVTGQQFNEFVQYQFSKTEWNTILSIFDLDAPMTLEVWGYHHQYWDTSKNAYVSVPESGPYRSVQKTFNTYNFERQLTIPANARYTEELLNINAPQRYRDYYTTFERSGYYTIQTFGILWTYLEVNDDQGNFLTANVDSGYVSNPPYIRQNSLLTYYFEQGQEYKIRLAPYLGSGGGKVRLAITPTINLLSSYRDILPLPYGVDIAVGRLQQYSADFYTIRTDTQRLTTVQLKSDLDTFLYVIDPRSSEAISSNPNDPSSFDDDSGEGNNGKITKILDANVDYLIIVSAYNITSTSGTYIVSIT